MRPPNLTVDENLLKCVSRTLGDGITLTAPDKGAYHSAVTMHDLNADGVDEAVVFYVDNADSSIVNFSVFIRDKASGWRLAFNKAGNGSGVYSLEFSDLNSDGCDDVLASWYTFDFKASRYLTVYLCSAVEDGLKINAAATEPYNCYLSLNTPDDPATTLVLAYTDVAHIPSKTSVKLMKLSAENTMELIREIPLDSSIITITDMQSDLPSGMKMPRVFIDASIGDSMMVTEVLSWNESAGAYVSLFTDQSTQRNTTTRRSDNLPSRDVDSDMLIEIPRRTELPLTSDSRYYAGYAVQWCSLEKDELIVKETYLVNAEDGYRFYYPSKWNGTVTVSDEDKQDGWVFLNGKGKRIFSIVRLDKDDYDESDKSISEVLAITGDYVFACRITDAGKAFGIVSTDLIKYFELT